MEPIGYYLTCDDAVCAEHVTVIADGYDVGTYFISGEQWAGFEDWPDPLPIFWSDEADTPTHCVECEALIPHRLTDYGMEYVREALEMPGGRRCIERAWVLEYLPSQAHIVRDWPTHDAYSPKELHA